MERTNNGADNQTKQEQKSPQHGGVGATKRERMGQMIWRQGGESKFRKHVVNIHFKSPMQRMCSDI